MIKDFHEVDFSGSVNQLYYEEKNIIDVMFFGPSTTLHGVVAPAIWNEYGFASWNWGMPNQWTFMSYYYIEEALMRQKPLIVVYDAYGFFAGSEELLGDYNIQFSLYPMRMGQAKCNALSALKRQRQKYDIGIDSGSKAILQYVFPLYQFHYRWNELEKKDYLGKNYNYKDEYVGGRMVSFDRGGGIGRLYSVPQEAPERVWDNGEEIALHPLVLEYFDMIYNLCEKNDIILILYNVPMLKWDMSYHKTVEKLAKDYKLDYYDLSMMEEEIGIDYGKDVVDTVHLNLWGGEKPLFIWERFCSQNMAC